ncbi:MAG: hypothetical protein E6Q40_11685 [Cupriavidus sp.]|nr:MAG: hypothetical protein E6Q40_11685 [Cupriavidus sp.]
MNRTPAPEIGAIYWAECPEVAGYARGKNRPVVILAVEREENATFVYVAGITTQRPEQWELGDVPLINDWRELGLTKPNKIHVVNPPHRIRFDLDWFTDLQPIGRLNHRLKVRLRAAMVEVGII